MKNVILFRKSFEKQMIDFGKFELEFRKTTDRKIRHSLNKELLHKTPIF